MTRLWRAWTSTEQSPLLKLAVLAVVDLIAWLVLLGAGWAAWQVVTAVVGP